MYADTIAKLSLAAPPNALGQALRTLPPPVLLSHLPPTNRLLRHAVNRPRTADQDRRRKVDHPLGCETAGTCLLEHLPLSLASLLIHINTAMGNFRCNGVATTEAIL